MQPEAGFLEKKVAATDIEAEAQRFLTAFIAELAGEYSAGGPRVLPFLHPSLVRGTQPDPYFFENQLAPAKARLHLIARPVEIDTIKPTNRKQLGFGQAQDTGTEWLVAVRRTQQTGAMPATVRLFFSEKNEAPKLSGISF